MQTDQSLKVAFWGVRGSYPTPGPNTVQVGGNTACVEIQAGGMTLILDAGTGLIGLGRSLVARKTEKDQPLQVTLLFSHLHHDHTQGFPFFTPAFIPGAALHLFGPKVAERSLKDVLASNMDPAVFPIPLDEMKASLFIDSLADDDRLLFSPGRLPQVLSAGEPLPDITLVHTPLVVRCMRSPAHPGSVLVYRIEYQGRSVVYATDTEGYANTDRRLVDFARGADLLIHDSQYTDEHYLGLIAGRPTQGWGHSTPRMACDVARSAGVQQLALFHFDPTYSDQDIARMEADARRRFSGAFAAREGVQIAFDLPRQLPQQLPQRLSEQLVSSAEKRSPAVGGMSFSGEIPTRPIPPG